MARTLAGYLYDRGIEVAHARDLDFHKMKDIEWIQELGSATDDWLVISGDGRIHRNRAEREAFRRAGLGMFVLAPAYQKTPMGRCCGFLVANWDGLLDYAARTEKPFMFQLTMQVVARFKPLPL